MTGNEYQKQALRTANSILATDLINNGALGLCGEAGEVADLVKKHLFQGHTLDRDKLIDELSDVCWYIAILAYGLDVPLDDILEHNIAKLRRRYPAGFEAERSMFRGEA